jgi:hypothetical protein
MNGFRRYELVLSVYPNTRGFAFVLFEGPLSPFDWGVKEMRGRGKHSRCLAKIIAILDRYQPEIMVLQDTSSNGTRRARGVTNLNAAISELADDRGILVYPYSREDVRGAFGYLGAVNKQIIAEVIAKHIPAFGRYVPPPRKPWMSEDARMGLFDAAALGLVFFQSVNRHERVTPLDCAASMTCDADRRRDPTPIHRFRDGDGAPTRLDRPAFQAADRLLDSELAQSPAAAVHRSDRPGDRAGAC